jgi:hypothetical protein
MRSPRNRNELVGRGIERRHEVLTDERLQDLVERYSRLGIRDFTGARFEEYVANPDGLDRQVLRLTSAIRGRSGKYRKGRL